MAKNIFKEKTICLFKIMEDYYSISIDAVEETIKTPKNITPLPNMNENFEGIINHRIDICMVVSLRNFFKKEFKRSENIIILNFNKSKVGLSVDTVPEIVDVKSSNIENSFKKLSGSRVSPSNYIAGIFELNMKDGMNKKKIEVTHLDIFSLLNFVLKDVGYKLNEN